MQKISKSGPEDFGVLDYGLLSIPYFGDSLYGLKRLVVNKQPFLQAQADVVAGNKNPLTIGGSALAAYLGYKGGTRLPYPAAVKNIGAALNNVFYGGTVGPKLNPKRFPALLASIAAAMTANSAVSAHFTKKQMKKRASTSDKRTLFGDKDSKATLLASVGAGAQGLLGAGASMGLGGKSREEFLKLYDLDQTEQLYSRFKNFASRRGIADMSEDGRVYSDFGGMYDRLNSSPSYMPADYKGGLLLPEEYVQHIFDGKTDAGVKIRGGVFGSTFDARKARATHSSNFGKFFAPFGDQPGVLAHELGHAMGPKHYMNSLSRVAGKFGPLLGGGMALLADDEKVGLLSALLGTGAAGHMLASEIDASVRGAKILRKFTEQAKLPTNRLVRLSPFLGLPSYAAVAAAPLTAYMINKRLGGYKKKDQKLSDRILSYVRRN